MKECKTCRQLKEENRFEKKRASCVDCRNSYKKNNYLKNADKCKAKSLEWKKKNKEHCLLVAKSYYKKNSEKIKKFHKDNRQYYNEIYKKRYERIKNTKEGCLLKLSKSIRTCIVTAITKRGFTKKSKTYKMLGCTYDEFLLFIGPKPEGNYHLDHICPCAQAQSEEELIKLQHYTNFRWLKAEENMFKSDTWTPEGEELCCKLLNRGWTALKSCSKNAEVDYV